MLKLDEGERPRVFMCLKIGAAKFVVPVYNYKAKIMPVRFKINLLWKDEDEAKYRLTWVGESPTKKEFINLVIPINEPTAIGAIECAIEQGVIATTLTTL